MIPLAQTIDHKSIPTGFSALADRARAAGLFLVALGNDGSVAACDRAAAPVFSRYLLALIEADHAVNAALPAEVTVSAYGPATGVWVGSVAWNEKRVRRGSFLLLALSPRFGSCEVMQRHCRALSLSEAELIQQAQAICRHDRSSVLAHTQSLVHMATDQQHLAADRRELRSLSEQLCGSYEELSLVYQVSAQMRVDRASNEFFEQLCLDLLPVLQARGLGFSLASPAAPANLSAIYGLPLLADDQRHRLGQTLIARFRNRVDPLLISDLNADPELRGLADSAQTLLAVPMRTRDRLQGCLFAIDKQGGEFNSSDAKLVAALAEQASIYLANSRLFDDLHGLLMGLLHSLTSAIDAKDPYTCGHSQRVALLSRHLARAAGLPEQEVERVYVAALLHDVGKIGVPEAVLHKTGRLTDDEFAIIKLHPATGSRILQDIRQLQHVLPGVLHHHERFDGRGYPDRLAGDGIPLMGRIICLADSFDAMTSDRTYRKGMPIETALYEIRGNAGAQFDPDLTNAFLRTSGDDYRELLLDHGNKSRQLLMQGRGGVAA